MPDEVYISSEAIKRLLSSPDGPAARLLIKKAVRVESAAKALCVVDTGRLRSSIHWAIGRDTKGLYADVGTNVKYAAWIEFGTGIYGPRATPIVPRSAPFLAWRDKGGNWHRARSVRGRKATPYLRPALRAAA